MDARPGPAVSQRIYNDIVPPDHDLIQGDRADTIIIDVTGFKREHIKVQIDYFGKLMVNGERPLEENKLTVNGERLLEENKLTINGEHPLEENKWIRFRKDFQTTENCDKFEICAKFENGCVYITLPKLVVDPVPPPQDQPTQATAQDKKATEPKLPSTDQNKHSKLANGEQTGDIVLPHDLIQGDRADTIIIDVTGFKKEQIKVLIDNFGKLTVNGERPLEENKWIRFRKDFQTSENCDMFEIRAKFENGRFYITLPKLVVDPVAPPQDQPTQATAQDKKATEPKLPSTDQNKHSKLANGEQIRNIVPPHDLIQGDRADTIIIDVTGFKREQIKVQIDYFAKLRVNGERLEENTWIRFRKYFQTPENCNKAEIRAKFENDRVYITLPKLVVDLAPPPQDQPT